MKSLNRAWLESEGKIIKNFEAMDKIYKKVRNRTNEGIIKLEAYIKPQVHSLFYDKKADIYTLMKEK